VQVSALDFPVFYRAPLFSGMPKREVVDWTTKLSVRYGYGSTRRSRDYSNDQRQLLSIYGPVNLHALGVGLEGIDKKTETNTFWGTGNFKNIKTDDLGQNDGKIDVFGKIKTWDLSFELEQGLWSGFFVNAYVPVRYVKIDNVKFKNLGEAKVGPSGGTQVDVESFLENTFEKVLQENGFVTFDKPFKKTEVPECTVSVGWEGENEEDIGVFESVRGRVQLGVMIPCGSMKNEDYLVAIPTGYNNHWGVHARAKAEIEVWKFLVVGANAGISMFYKSIRNIRMKTNKAQQGWFTLEKGSASVEPGSLWDVAGYLKAEEVFGGLSVLLGYTFAKQEDMYVSVRDDNFLKTVVEKAEAGDSTVTPVINPSFISKDDIVNTDNRFKSWEQHVLFAYVQYDVKAHTDSMFAPAIAFEYSHPVAGRRVFSNAMIAGSLSLQASWDF